MQKSQLDGTETDDNWVENKGSGACQCMVKLHLPGSLVIHMTVQPNDCSSGTEEKNLEEDSLLEGGRHVNRGGLTNILGTSQGNGNKWPREVEERIHRMKNKRKCLLREDGIKILFDRRRKIRYVMMVAKEIAVTMDCYSILLFVVLKLKDESKGI